MKYKDIEFLRITPLRGPNIWTYRPIIEAWVDIGDLEDAPSNKIPGFYERLSAWLPSLIEHRCSEGDRGGFLQRVREGTWAGHILEHVTLELQNLAGQRTGFGNRINGAVLENPDFLVLGRAFGIDSHRVDSPEALRPVLRDAIAAGQPALIEVTVAQGSETSPWEFIHMAR